MKRWQLYTLAGVCGAVINIALTPLGVPFGLRIAVCALLGFALGTFVRTEP
jgi:hypothetical protein